MTDDGRHISDGSGEQKHVKHGIHIFCSNLKYIYIVVPYKIHRVFYRDFDACI